MQREWANHAWSSVAAGRKLAARPARGASPVPSRRGLTLVEMLVAMAVMSIIAVAMVTVSAGTHSAAEYSTGQADALQHARVALERIERMVQESSFTEAHPGAVVVYEQFGTYRYPDTLLVWRPASGVPANAEGPPLINEVLIYCPNPAKPRELVELRHPFDTSPIPFDPAQLNTPAWRTALAAIKNDPRTEQVVLTDLVRLAQPTGRSETRGAVRFDAAVNPTAAQMAAYRAGSTAWKNLPWPTVHYGNQFGLRQLSVRIELQLVAGGLPGKIDNAGANTLPFFGSTARYQRLTP